MRAWVVMIRLSDGDVVSRQFDGTSWSTTDRMEIVPEGGELYSWPNLLRSVTDGRLHLIVRGPPSLDDDRLSVLAFQRKV